MHSSAFRILLLALLAAWFGVLLPVHVRGQIKLPGARPEAKHCCARDVPSRQDPGETPARSDDCAVCHYLAGLDMPAVFVIDVRPLGRVDEPVPTPLTSIFRAAPPRLHLGRAPPATC